VAKFFSQGGENESVREAKILVVCHFFLGGKKKMRKKEELCRGCIDENCNIHSGSEMAETKRDYTRLLVKENRRAKQGKGKGRNGNANAAKADGDPFRLPLHLHLRH
jgi:hypothetical protein